MSRHNKYARGKDQLGFRYRISYPPDWLDRIKVTRRLHSGRQSTKTLFRNPVRVPKTSPGGLIRIQIESGEQDLLVEARVRADADRVGEVVVTWRGDQAIESGTSNVRFTLVGFAPASRSRGEGGRMDYLS